MIEAKPLEQRRTTHDFFNDKTWLLTILGFRQSRKIPYFIYRGCLLLLMTSLTLLAIYAAILVPNKKLRIDATHYCLLAWHAIWGLVARILTHKSLNQTKKIVQAGIYNYNEEEVDEEVMKIKEGILGEIRWKFNFFLVLCLSGIASNQLLFPLSQFFFVTEDDFVINEDWMNPYLPHFLYMPFNTRSTLGYCVAHLLDSLCYFCLYMTTLSMCFIYISCEVQVKTHLQVLRHSLRNIQARAFTKYKKREDTIRNLANMDEDELFKSKAFQSCLYSCLKSNVKHHQALIRLMKQVQPFIGSSLLVIFLVVAIIYAAELYLMFQKPRVNLMVNYILTFAAESTYAYQVCVFGEEIIQESERLYQSLYSIPWFRFGKEFNQTLHVMMSNTLKPMQFRALLLGTSASIDSYGSVHSIVNFQRHRIIRRRTLDYSYINYSSVKYY